MRRIDDEEESGGDEKKDKMRLTTFGFVKIGHPKMVKPQRGRIYHEFYTEKAMMFHRARYLNANRIGQFWTLQGSTKQLQK